VRQSPGRLLYLRRLVAPQPSGHVERSPIRYWAARAVLVWAVLAGLFLMHGVASSAGGCHGSEPVASAMAMGPQAVVAMPGAVTADRTDALASPGRAGAAAARQFEAPAPATFASAATALKGDQLHGGMLCSSRLPRQGFLGVSATGPPAAVLFFVAALALLPFRAGVSRRFRPPGRPGLPLPLFLGVSRT
jgi:hypothetical protein